ncbi:MAG: DEAD/DEAH box helicase [Actinomycetota bacterium]
MSNSTFADLGISPQVVSALTSRNILEPFPIQRLVIADAIAGKDVLAKSRTGSGKTLGFALPIVERLDPGDRRPGALILVPTRELAVQVTEEFAAVCKPKKLKVAAAYGGVGMEGQASRLRGAHVIVATPGRLEDFASRRTVDLSSIRILVLDEADRMLDMGFLPQVNRIVRRIPTDRQTMFFSATLDGAIGHMAKAYTRDPVKHEVVSPTVTVEEISHRFLPVEADRKAQALVDLLKAEGGLSLVFVRTKRGADRLAMKLKGQGIASAAMHGDMSQSARQRALENFDRGKITTLVATDVAARGLDIDDVTHVINYDPPEDHKAYLHRVGRTGRAGREGQGVTLVSSAERGDVGRVASVLNLSKEFEAHGMKVSPPRIAFSSGRGRRRRRSGSLR